MHKPPGSLKRRAGGFLYAAQFGSKTMRLTFEGFLIKAMGIHGAMTASVESPFYLVLQNLVRRASLAGLGKNGDY